MVYIANGSDEVLWLHHPTREFWVRIPAEFSEARQVHMKMGFLPISCLRGVSL